MSEQQPSYQIEEMDDANLADSNFSEIIIIIAVVIAIGAAVAGFMYYNKQRKEQQGTPGEPEQSWVLFLN